MRTLIAGTLALTMNLALLTAAARVPLLPVRGDMLRLLTIHVWPFVAPYAVSGGLTSRWLRLGLPLPGSPGFTIGFHVLSGYALAFIYTMMIEPSTTGPAWRKGFLFALVIWTLHACIVQPALGEGIAGSLVLTTSGIAYFAVAHTLFFLVLAIVYAGMGRRPALPVQPTRGYTR